MMLFRMNWNSLSVYRSEKGTSESPPKMLSNDDDVDGIINVLDTKNFWLSSFRPLDYPLSNTTPIDSPSMMLSFLRQKTADNISARQNCEKWTSHSTRIREPRELRSQFIPRSRSLYKRSLPRVLSLSCLSSSSRVLILCTHTLFPSLSLRWSTPLIILILFSSHSASFLLRLDCRSFFSRFLAANKDTEYGNGYNSSHNFSPSLCILCIIRIVSPDECL